MDCGGMTCLPDRQAPLSLHAPPTVSVLELPHTVEPIHRAAKAGTCPGTCPRSPRLRSALPWPARRVPTCRVAVQGSNSHLGDLSQLLDSEIAELNRHGRPHMDLQGEDPILGGLRRLFIHNVHGGLVVDEMLEVIAFG